MRNPASLALALALLGLPLAVAAAQQRLEMVDSAMARELARTATPGGAVAIVSGDRVVYAKGFGRTAPDSGDPVTAATLFRIASVTKLFTATALLELAAPRRLDLAAPIDTLLGPLPAALRVVTPHQLLSHTAGLQFGPIIPGGQDPATALAQSVSRIPARVAFTAPGAVFSYSNIGYQLAGRLVEVLAGRSFAEQVTANLLEPLGMRSSGFDPAVIRSVTIARPTLDSGSTATTPTPSAGAESWPFAGLYSSADDLAHFAIAFLNGGMYQGRRVISPASIARISAPAAAFQSGEGDYGYAVRVYRHRGLDVVEHGGIAPGYRALLYMVPAKRIAVIVLANRLGRRPYAVADAALDALLPGLPQSAAPAGEVPFTADEMARYVGSYAGGVVVRVTVDDGVLTMHQGPASLRVHKLSTGELVVGEGDGRLRMSFVTGADGEIRFLHYNMRAYQRMGPPAP